MKVFVKFKLKGCAEDNILRKFLRMWLLGYKRELRIQIERILKTVWSQSRGRNFGHFTSSQVQNLLFGGCTGLCPQVEREKWRTNAGGRVKKTSLNPYRELRPQEILPSSPFQMKTEIDTAPETLWVSYLGQ